MNNKKKALQLRNSTAEFLIFSYQTGGDGVEVRVQDGTVWLSQKSLGQLFDTTPENILMHLKNIFKNEELSADSVTTVATYLHGFLPSCRRVTIFRKTFFAWGNMVVQASMNYGNLNSSFRFA